MTKTNTGPFTGPQALDHAALHLIGGGMINLREERPIKPIEPGHGGLDLPYWADSGAMRFGAGPWDYGYGSPTGPWPA